MAETKEAIQDAAARNAALLSTLSETDYAPPALEQQTKYIVDLDYEIKKTNVELRKLTAKREKELKDHEKYQQSVMKKFAHKVSGKSDDFKEKASKEEREYFEALEEEHKANRLKESLTVKLKEAEEAKANLEPIVKKHDDAQKELDDLYNRIFSGPTPAFPEEDAAEETTKRALEAYRDVQSKLDAEKQVSKIFGQAEGVMRSIISNLDEAHSASTFDMFGGGLMADMMERSALGRADTGVTQLKSLLNEASRVSPAVKPIGEMKVAGGHLMSDVLFDNIFTDMAMHDKIKDSEREMQVAQQALKEQVTSNKERVKELDGHLSKATSDLEAARQELQRIRTDAFNRVAPQ